MLESKYKVQMKEEKMETREQLLNNLHYVENKVTEIINLCQQELEIERRFRVEHKEVKVLSPKTIFMMLAIAFGIISLMMGGKFAIIVAVVLLAVKLIKGKIPKPLLLLLILLLLDGITMLYKSLQNGAIAGFVMLMAFFVVIIVVAIVLFNVYAKKQNEKIIAHNQVYYERYDQVEVRLNQARSELYENAREWYPKDYYNPYAIRWFIRAVENFRCSTISELVKEFEQSEYQRQMLEGQKELQIQVQNGFAQVISNQQQIQQQLRFANVMSVMNFAEQLNTQRRIDEQGDRIVKAVNRKNL